MALDLTMEETVASIQNNCENMLKATSEIKGSARFKYLLHICLMLGNELNKGSRSAV